MAPDGEWVDASEKSCRVGMGSRTSLLAFSTSDVTKRVFPLIVLWQNKWGGYDYPPIIRALPIAIPRELHYISIKALLQLSLTSMTWQRLGHQITALHNWLLQIALDNVLIF